jgi:acyl-CoA thioester hydrolase
MPRVLTDRFVVPTDSIDVNGHVNNQEYVRWMQDIATAHSEAQGWPLSRYLETKSMWVVRSHHIEYVRPAFAGDELIVATWVAAMNAQTSPRKVRFVRARDGKTLVEAETLWVYCDATSGRPLAIAAEVADAFPVVDDAAEIGAAIAALRSDA